MTYREIIVGVLDIIDYTDDKEAFVKQFMTAAQLQTVFDLGATLERPRQDELDEALVGAGQDPDARGAAVSKFFTPDEIQAASAQAVVNELADFLKTIEAGLSEDQLRQIAELLQTADPKLAPAA